MVNQILQAINSDCHESHKMVDVGLNKYRQLYVILSFACLLLYLFINHFDYDSSLFCCGHYLSNLPEFCQPSLKWESGNALRNKGDYNINHTTWSIKVRTQYHIANAHQHVKKGVLYLIYCSIAYLNFLYTYMVVSMLCHR